MNFKLDEKNLIFQEYLNDCNLLFSSNTECILNEIKEK